jgi:hypothetical protein
MASVYSVPTTPMKTSSLQLTNYDCLQILACSQALDMASKHKMYLAHPSMIRATASQWLTSANVPHSAKAKWATLHTLFMDTFGELLQQMKAERNAKKAE